MGEQITCELCGALVSGHASYVVRIDVFADPSLPPMNAEEIAGQNFQEALGDLLEQMKHLTADDLQDSVHRRFEYRLCGSCHLGFLANPLGKPRKLTVGNN